MRTDQFDFNEEFWPRLLGYLSIGFLYLIFMESHAPQGVKWAAYHGQRIFNAVEYLRLHGYFSNYGYSVWTSCVNCDLTAKILSEKIYLSSSAMKLWPYILLNEWGGKASLFSYGHLIDKFVIGATSILLSELTLAETNLRDRLSRFWLGCAVSMLFLTAPWTYKMMIAAWADIWFAFFLIIAFYALLSGKVLSSSVFYFMACVMHYQWGLVTGAAIFFLSLLATKFSEDHLFGKFIPKFPRKTLGATAAFAISLIPAIQEILLRAYVRTQLANTDGSSLIWRIGVSGEDMHNGGILGALQFLGGIRITNCFRNPDGMLSALSLDAKISLFNCGLTVAGFAIISLVSIFGLNLFFRFHTKVGPFFFITAVGLLVFVSFLQQSLSVHLLGYSYIFSLLFSAGVVGFFEIFYFKSRSNAISMTLLTPIVFAICILSIHISMLEKVTQ